MRYPIKRASETVATIRPEGTHKRTLMAENILSLTFKLFTYVDVKIGGELTFKGEVYKVKELPNVNKLQSNKFEYALELKNKSHYELLDSIYFGLDPDNNLTEGDHSLMGKAEAHIDLLIMNLNRNGSGWTKGTIADTQAKNISYSNQTCLSVLTDLAIDFELEWSIENKTISLKEKEVIVQDITFEYGRGKGLYSIQRNSVTDKSLVTRLYAFGSDKNLPPNYRGTYVKRLRLPDPIESLEKNVDKYGVLELSKTFDDIYPRRTGVVTSVAGLDEFSIYDTEIDFNINDQLLPNDEPAKIVFNSGQLAGYTFEIASFDNDTKKITFNVNKDETAFTVPNPLLKASLGDEYVLIDIEMPASYVEAAELELQEAAQAYLDENSEPWLRYSVRCDKMEARRRGVTIGLGNYVRIVDTDFGVDKNIRVNSITENIQDEFDYELELSDTTTINTVVKAYAAAEKRVKQLYQNAITLGTVKTIAQEVQSAAILQQFKKTYVGDLAVLSGAFVVGNPDDGDLGGVTAEGSEPTDIIFFGGSSYADRATAPFRVQRDGFLASTSGLIGGWNIGVDKIFSGELSGDYIELQSGTSPRIFMKNADQVVADDQYSQLTPNSFFIASNGETLPVGDWIGAPTDIDNVVAGIRLKDFVPGTDKRFALYLKSQLGNSKAIALKVEGNCDISGNSIVIGASDKIQLNGETWFLNGDIFLPSTMPSSSGVSGLKILYWNPATGYIHKQA